MRGCSCNVYAYYKDKLIKSTATACWSMLAYPQYFHADFAKNANYSKPVQWPLGRDIYIAEFDEPKTQKYQQTLFSIINEITPCKVVEMPQDHGEILKRDTRFIEFRMLETYDQNLIVLNFIRNLWYNPVPQAKENYTIRFFEFLEGAARTNSDPLMKLTWANKSAIELIACPYGSPGHSNVHAGIKLKTTEQLKAYKGVSTREFLTTE